MAVTVEDLAGEVNASPADPSLPVILADAEELVDSYLGADGILACPVRIRDLAVRQLSGELYARRSAPMGVASWGPDGAPVRLSKDLMLSVRTLLRPYRSLGTVG